MTCHSLVIRKSSIHSDLGDHTSCSEGKYKSVSNVLDDRQSPWTSMWISIAMQFNVGVQISIYYMSMWPYLNGLDKSVTLDFLGWVVASCSFGCSLANPLFGWWNQKTMSATYPTILGLIIASIGQCMYGLLPLFHSHQKWMMIIARFITGIGAAYLATASVPKDRLRAISFGTAGYVLGISFGPAIQAVFTAVGEKGFTIGPVIFNMYTLPAFFMVVLSLIFSIIMKIFFKEEYSGIIAEENNDDEYSQALAFSVLLKIVDFTGITF